MIKKVHGTEASVHPKQAENFLAFNTIGHQRTLQRSHIEKLKRHKLDGTFLTGHIAFAYNGDRQTPILVNGQHQLHMIKETGIPTQVFVEKYHVDSYQDLHILFGCFDNNMPRTQTQINSMYKITQDRKWSTRFINLIVYALANIKGTKSMDKTKKPLLIEEHEDFVSFVHDIFKDGKADMPKDCYHLQRPIIVENMYMTYNKNITDAYRFWMGVRDGEKLQKNDPQMQLRNYLLMNSGGKAKAMSKQSRHELTTRAVRTWNAFRMGRELKKIYYNPEEQIPKLK